MTGVRNYYTVRHSAAERLRSTKRSSGKCQMIKMLSRFIAALVFSASNSYADISPQLKPAADVLVQVSKSEVRPYSTRDFGREKYSGAISILVPESEAKNILTNVRKKISKGFVAFIGTTRSLEKPAAVGVEIVVGLGSGPLDILDIAQTDAVNYDMVTSNLKEKLGIWHAAYGIDIWQAETDTIQLQFVKLPSNIESFAKEVYDFCPDIVDQGVETLPALEAAIREQEGLYLWWD